MARYPYGGTKRVGHQELQTYRGEKVLKVFEARVAHYNFTSDAIADDVFLASTQTEEVVEQTLAPASQPDVPRSLRINVDTNAAGVDVSVTGTNAAGEAITYEGTALSSGDTDTEECFATIESITIGTDDPTLGNVKVGNNRRIGMPGVFRHDPVFKVMVNDLEIDEGSPGGNELYEVSVDDDLEKNYIEFGTGCDLTNGADVYFLLPQAE